jgi:hypothetical protein
MRCRSAAIIERCNGFHGSQLSCRLAVEWDNDATEHRPGCDGAVWCTIA